MDRDKPVNLRVIEKVAAREGVEPTALSTPLYDVVDPDALDALFSPSPGASGTTPDSVTFPYCGYQVTVEGSGAVRLTPLPGGSGANEGMTAGSMD